jgi:hypothetical protein
LQRLDVGQRLFEAAHTIGERRLQLHDASADADDARFNSSSLAGLVT